MTLSEIAVLLGGKLVGPGNIQVSGPAKIEDAKEGEITFLSNLKYKHFLENTQASAVLLSEEPQVKGLNYILVENPYIAFLKVLALFEPTKHTAFSGQSSSAAIDPSAVIADKVQIAPFVFIGPNVKIGLNTIIYPGVVLAENVKVGADCVLYPNVSVRENCELGDRVILHNGCVIGSDGFGFAPDGGKYHKIPQIGNVLLEDDVEIGANSTIDRATVGSTVIRTGTKLDNLIQVAHNVVIGAHTVVAAQTGIAGSTKIGDHVQLGGQSAITGHIKIGDQAIVAARSGVARDIEPKTVVWGTPAIPITQQKRLEVHFQNLPKMAKRIRDLEKELQQIKNTLSESGKASNG